MARDTAPTKISLSFAGSYFERALHEAFSIRSFDAEDRRQTLEFLGDDSCVYCGTTPANRWDHLVAVRAGGDTVLGNLVPACGRCDDSKGKRHFEPWMLGTARYSPASRGIADLGLRVQKLYELQAHFGYEPRPLEDRLTADQAVRLAEIRSRFASLRADAAALLREIGLGP